MLRLERPTRFRDIPVSKRFVMNGAYGPRTLYRKIDARHAVLEGMVRFESIGPIVFLRRKHRPVRFSPTVNFPCVPYGWTVIPF